MSGGREGPELFGRLAGRRPFAIDKMLFGDEAWASLNETGLNGFLVLSPLVD